MSDQSSPKLRQHAEIEARIRQLQTQTVFPVDTSPHRGGGLPSGEVLRELQHRDHRQLPWRNPRLATDPERVDERPSAKTSPSSSRTRMASVPFRNAASATAAVCSGTSGSARGRIDIATHLTQDADTSHTTPTVHPHWT